jgi:hypothetical protein
MEFVFLLRKLRKLKIHQPIVADVSHKIGTAACAERRNARRGSQRDHLRISASRRIEEINNRLPDLIASIRIGHEIHVSATILEHATL